jgi:hypothetical protein
VKGLKNEEILAPKSGILEDLELREREYSEENFLFAIEYYLLNIIPKLFQ